MRYTIPSFIATALLAALAVQAGDIYRWKDANGTWHYADQPVPGAERLTTSSHPPPAQNDATDSPDGAARKPAPASATASPAAPSGQIAQKVRQDVAAARAEHCKQATEAYQQSISARRLYKAGANGEPEYLDDAQMDAHRVAARSEMDNLCGN